MHNPETPLTIMGGHQRKQKAGLPSGEKFQGNSAFSLAKLAHWRKKTRYHSELAVLQTVQK